MSTSTQIEGVDWLLQREIAADLNKVRLRGLHRIDDFYLGSRPCDLPYLDQLLKRVSGEFANHSSRAAKLRALILVSCARWGQSENEDDQLNAIRAARLIGAAEETWLLEDRSHVESRSFLREIRGRRKQDEVTRIRMALALALVTEVQRIESDRESAPARIHWAGDPGSLQSAVLAELCAWRDADGISARAIEELECSALMSLDVTESERRRLSLGLDALAEAADSAVRCVLSDTVSPERVLLRTMLRIEGGPRALSVRRKLARPHGVTPTEYLAHETAVFESFSVELSGLNESPCGNFGKIQPSSIAIAQEMEQLLLSLPPADQLSVAKRQYDRLFVLLPFIHERALSTIPCGMEESDDQWMRFVYADLKDSLRPWLPVFEDYWGSAFQAGEPVPSLEQVLAEVTWPNGPAQKSKHAQKYCVAVAVTMLVLIEDDTTRDVALGPTHDLLGGFAQYIGPKQWR